MVYLHSHIFCECLNSVPHFLCTRSDRYGQALWVLTPAPAQPTGTLWSPMLDDDCLLLELAFWRGDDYLNCVLQNLNVFWLSHCHSDLFGAVCASAGCEYGSLTEGQGQHHSHLLYQCCGVAMVMVLASMLSPIFCSIITFCTMIWCLAGAYQPWTFWKTYWCQGWLSFPSRLLEDRTS